MRHAATPVVLLSLLTAAPLAAQSDTVPAGPAAVTIAPSHLEAARNLLRTMNFEETAVATAMYAFDEQVGDSPEAAAFRDVIEEWMREVLGGEKAEIAFAEAYAEALTEAELVELTAFFRTPLGVRLAEAQPLLAARGAEIGARLAAEGEASLQERLMERATLLEPDTGTE
jgi:hypothetical protein